MTTTEPEARRLHDARPRRSGVSVRTRITAAVAVLVASALLGVGLIVWTIESSRVEQQTVAEVDQELDEFDRLQGDGVDPQTGQPFTSVEALVRLFLERNVPDDDEALIGWVDDQPVLQFSADALVDDPAFLDAVAGIVDGGGSTRLDTSRGATLVASQPVVRGDETGALTVVKYLDEDRDELIDTMRTFALVAVLLWMLVVAVAAWTSGRLLAPLRVLRSTAEEIGDSDLSRRIPESGNDDITALTRTVNTMLDRLETAFGDQRRFLDDAGHELRTPLTVLRGHLELLDAANPVDVAETRTLLLDEVDRMARLVGDLILLAKSDRPDFVSPGPVSVADLTVEVLAKARALGERRWSLDQAASLTATLDQQRMTQALLQLCDNAVKHTGPGDAVALGSSYDGAQLHLWVRDSGAGVAPEHRKRIFQRFGRAQVPDGDEGFGLGLSIVGAIAQAHGGTVHVEPVETTAPTGARFVITVPVTPLPVPPDHATPGPAAPGPGAEPGATTTDHELLDTQPLQRQPRGATQTLEEPAWPAS